MVATKKKLWVHSCLQPLLQESKVVWNENMYQTVVDLRIAYVRRNEEALNFQTWICV